MRGLLVTLGLLLTITWIGGGYLLYTVIRDDEAMSKKAASQSVQIADAARRYAQVQAEKTALTQQLQATQSDLRHPTLGIWNVGAAISGPDAYLAGGIPDTFTYHLKFTSDAPVSVTYMTTREFANALTCVTSGRGNSHGCLSKTGKGWLDVTTLNEDIHIAEGCADYLLVFTAARSANVHPDVSVTYNPASAPTGTCAG